MRAQLLCRLLKGADSNIKGAMTKKTVQTAFASKMKHCQYFIG